MWRTDQTESENLLKILRLLENLKSDKFTYNGKKMWVLQSLKPNELCYYLEVGIL